MKNYRHGDLFLKFVTTIPKNVKKVAHRPLALGEITGHSHRLNGEHYELYEDGRTTYLQVFSPIPLIHEEHREQVILPGMYEIVNEKEFDYGEEDLKIVGD